MGNGKRKNDEDAGQGMGHLRAVQARLFPFKILSVCPVAACVVLNVLDCPGIPHIAPAFSFTYSGVKGREEGEKRRKQSGDKSPHSSEGEDHGRDNEREDAEDMSEFKTCCWECKSGKYMKSRNSTKQCRKVRWILLSCCDAVLCVMIIIICCVICYNTMR